MPNATVTGATGGVVNVIPQATSGNTTAAQTLVGNVGALATSGVASFVSFTASSIPAPTTTTIASVGASSPTAMGAQNLGTLTPNVVSVLINNTDRTSFSNTQFNNNETVIAGAGGLNFTDSGSNTTVNVGGGANTITFGGTSQNGTFAGDGTNTITVNSKSGVATIVGTGASVDSVFGGGSGAILFTAQSGSKAVVNPGAGNVTIVGTGGAAQTVFGGTQVISDGKGGVTTVVGTTFTGSLSVTGGQGYFKGGTNGGNFMQSGTAGSTTLVGGGNGDVMSAYGANDVLVGAASGLSTLDGSNSAGGDVFWTGIDGASNMYGGKSVGDTFYLGNSTANGVGYKGSFISLHTGPNNNGTLYTLNNNVKNTINVAVFGETGIQSASVADFITGVDTLRIGTAQGALTFSNIFSGTAYAGVQIVTKQGSTIMLYNNTTFTEASVVRV